MLMLRAMGGRHHACSQPLTGGHLEAGAQVGDHGLQVRRRQRCSLLRALRADEQLQQPDAFLLHMALACHQHTY